MSFLDEHGLSAESLLEAMPDGTALIDHEGVIRWVNDVLSALTGYGREELVGQSVQTLVPDRLRDRRSRAIRAIHDDPNSSLIWENQDLSVLCKGGVELAIDFALSSIAVDGERWLLASIRDNTTRRLADEARSEAERNFRLAFEFNMAPMVMTDLNDCVIAANDAFCQLVGRGRDELLGFDSKPFTLPEDVGITESSHNKFIHGEVEQVRYEKRYLHTDGRTIVVEVSKSPARDKDGNTLYFIISERDITEERNLTAQLSYQALHDPLTGLANRTLFEDRLVQAKSRIVRQGGFGALILLDLDDFKGVNDTYGHVVGDQLLTEVAHRLEGVTRSSDTLCRFGGDEFLYLAEGLAKPDDVEHVITRLTQTLEDPIDNGGVQLDQRASFGVAIWGSDDGEGNDVVADADVALYEAKRLGKGRHVIFSPGMHERVVDQFALLQQLRHAEPDEELMMHYQPIISLETLGVVGFESLMRWRHAERGWVSPSLFIPIAERSDRILDLGYFALREAISTARTWDALTGTGPLPYVTVNLSARQFYDPALMEFLDSELEKSGLAPTSLVIEITEGVALLEVAETLKMIEHLGELGVGIALDDFGTGFSSLSYLERLNPKIIKIDQYFVRPTMHNKHNDRVLETIVTLGHSLEITTLAEGIETTEQLRRLRDLDCSLGQGFLFSPAVPLDEATAMVGRKFMV